MVIQFDRYYRYEALTDILRAVAAEHPGLVQLRSLGKSHEGRDIWLVAVTAFETGPDTEKPALWVDGNLHASELAPSSACLYLIDWLVRGHGTHPDITRCLESRAFYICPRINPDGAEWALADTPKIIRSSTRPYPFDDEPFGELVEEDVDGDGRILTMRVPDSNGAWKICEREPRLLVRRDPAEGGGRYYRLLPEGRLEHFDGVSISVRPRREGLDLNRNFPAQWRQEHEQVGAGPYPTSEPEVRAVVQFITSHANITGGITFHTFSGVLLRPFSHQADDAFIPEDLWTYQAIGRRGEALTGYPALSVFHDFRYHPSKVLTGAFDDWMFEHLGLFAWTVEMWSPRREAGLEIEKYIEWYREHPVDDDLALLGWSDTVLNGAGYVDWYPFEHPELGPVELGGWDHLYAFRNPPPHRLERELERFPAWVLWHLQISPRLELHSTAIEALGTGSYRVRLVVHNTGWLPTTVSQHAAKLKLVRGVMAEITLPDGAALRSGRPRVDLGQLGGRSTKPSAPLWMQADPTDDLAVAEWVVDAPSGAVVGLTARHDRAGVVGLEIRLG